MSNAGSRRRRSLTSIAPSPLVSSSFPSASREAQSQSQLLPSWKFSQVLGELPLAAGGHDNGTLQDDGDTVSAIEFDGRGEHLAAGDHAGRVILFRRTDNNESHEQQSPPSRAELERTDYAAAQPPAYTYMAEFQSHEQEFDVLHSLEIGEKVKKLRWCARPNTSLCMLATNDRTVKLWKLQGRSPSTGRGKGTTASSRGGDGAVLRRRRCPKSRCSGRMARA